MVKFHMILPSHAKRCTVHFLPEEILFNILILLPAETLYDVVRYVCRQWYAIVQDPKFVSAHFLLSTTTLLKRTIYQDKSIPRGGWVDHYQLLDVKDSYANATPFKFSFPHEVEVFSTCNGLLLLFSISQERHYVVNPITRKLLALPKLSSSMIPVCDILAVSSSSRLYKVMLAYDDEKHIDCRCVILTLGVDKAWRVLDFTYLNLQMNFLFLGRPVSISGFIYWIPQSEIGFIYALDVDSEIVKRIAVPYHDTGKKHFLSKDDSISFLIYYPYFSIEVWVLKDTRSEEWVKFGHIEGGPTRNEWVNIMSHYNISSMLEFYCYVRPIFWLGNGEKILFDVRSPQDRGDFKTTFFVVYDLNSHTCSEFDRKCDGGCDFVPFMNSLAWI